MGCRFSAPRRVRTTEQQSNKPAKKKNETSTNVGSGEMSPLHQRSLCQEELGASTETTEEETLCQQEDRSSEKQSCSSAIAQVKSASLHCSETQDHDPVSTEEKEANWVDDNSADLIQNVTSVMRIADRMQQQGVIHQEMHANIHAAGTRMEKMRVLYRALRTTKAKSIFYRILQDIEPETCETEDVIREVMKKHKKYLREKLNCESEGAQKNNAIKNPLDKIYTELHIIQGESKRINAEHEIWEIEDKARIHTTESTKINCNDIFERTPDNSVSSGQNKGEVKAFRTVMTKGIAGIGKTVSVKKFILDWADGIANQDLDFIFVLPFRELNLVIEKKFTLVSLVREFHPELKNIAIVRVFDHYKVLFIFDGLDESQLKLDFKKATLLTSNTEESSVDVLVTNLIREHLLPSALVWITSRPRAVHRIPRWHISRWTEVRGFNDSQKVEYFRKRIDDTALAEKIVNFITRSRSLYIMCHIPIFCWIAATVFEYLVPKEGNIHDENEIPATLTEMYTHFLTIQMRVATEKYGSLDESDTEEIFKSNEEFLLKLGRMAFESLHDSKIIFTFNDLEKYGIDIDKAGVHCGLCTEVFKEEGVFNRKKLYCFVHLTVQEYFAALFVYRSFASKKLDSQILKDFLLKESEEELKATLDEDPVDLPLNELIEIAIANSTLRESGEMDMFLRFLVGMSLQSTQELLYSLIQQTEEHSEVIAEVRKSLLEIDVDDCSGERCLNHVHCLMELKDNSIHDTVRHCFIPDPCPERQLSPVQCSALADSILMSKTPLDEFNLKRYRPSVRGIFRLVPAVRNCRKARISGVHLNRWILETIASALQMQNSVLTELHLMNSTWSQHTSIFTEALMNTEAKLEALSLSGRISPDCENFASAIKSIISNLRELELSGNILGGSLCSLVSVVLCQPKLQKLRLNRNYGITNICKELVTSFTSSQCYLKELELSYCCFEDSQMDILSAGLMSEHCTLEVLSLSHNRLSETGCQTLASTLSSKTSHLSEVDLSYNDLHNSGVMALSNALRNPHCDLKTLRLSFCKVTGDGCASLASALRSDRCSLRELDLSFNHLTDQGAKLLTEIQRDPHYSLQELNVDQNEEYWFDWKLLRQYACDLTLDVNTVSKTLILTEDNKKASYVTEKQPYPDNAERFHENMVLCEEGLRSRHYWEVECISADIGVAYKSIDRESDCSDEVHLGKNEKSWCWYSDGSFYHNNSCLEFLDARQPLLSGTTGVFLDQPAGILSFFQVFPDSMTHLHTARATFTDPLYPGFSLDRTHPSSVYIRKIQ